MSIVVGIILIMVMALGAVACVWWLMRGQSSPSVEPSSCAEKPPSQKSSPKKMLFNGANRTELNNRIREAKTILHLKGILLDMSARCAELERRNASVEGMATDSTKSKTTTVE